MKKKRMLFLAMSCFIWTCAIQAQVNLNNTNAERDNEDETEKIEEIDEDGILRKCGHRKRRDELLSKGCHHHLDLGSSTDQ